VLSRKRSRNLSAGLRIDSGWLVGAARRALSPEPPREI
jgi:hypothetical protein